MDLSHELRSLPGESSQIYRITVAEYSRRRRWRSSGVRVLMAVSASGAITDTNNYDSFGNPSNTSFPTRFQYTGREYDGTSGFQYNRARWYDRSIGRFISEDPIGFDGGDVNLYGYTSNNPVNGTDPTGLYEIDVHYYLTYYLALRTGCFSQPQASAIANADQNTDEDPATSPGFNRRYQNSTYHALNPSARPGVNSPGLFKWRAAPTAFF